MTAESSISEPAASYGLAQADIQYPVVLQHEGQPLAVIISFKEYQRLRTLTADEEQRHLAGWTALQNLVNEIHQRYTEATPEQIETEISKAKKEVSKLSRDPDDDLLIETALAGHATHIVSRDEDVTRDRKVIRYLKENEIEPVTVQKFLSLF